MTVKPYTIDIKPDKLNEFKLWLQEQLENGLTHLHSRLERYDEIDRLLRGERPRKNYPYPNASNVVTPVTQIRVDAISDRLYDAIFEAQPVARLTAVTGVDEQTGLDWHLVAREATDWFNWAARQRTQLDAFRATRAAIRDFVRYGLGCIKVVHFLEQSKRGVYEEGKGWMPDPRGVTIYEGPRWFYVSVRDLVWPEGYGGDVQLLPWIAQRLRYSWSNLAGRAHALVYDPAAVQRIREHYTTTPSSDAYDTSPNTEDHLRRTYHVYEVWCRYDIDGDGIDEDLLVDWHHDTATPLRIIYAPDPQRPFHVSRLRDRHGTSFDALGVPDILRPTQDQIDALHNIAIDAARVALSHARITRLGSTLDRVLSDEQTKIGPGFECATESPQTDLVIAPLGDPRSAVQTLTLLQYLRKDAQDLVGIGAAQLGDIGALKRTPATGVARVMAEGGMFTRGATSRFVDAFRDAILHTFELLRRFGTKGRVYRTVGEDGIWLERALALPDDLRYSWAVQIAVADPDATPEQAVQRDLIIAQFMLGWMQQLGQTLSIITSPMPDVPDSLRIGLIELAEKSKRLVERVLENARTMQDLTALLPAVEQLWPRLMQQAVQERAALMHQQQLQMEHQAAITAMESAAKEKGNA